MKILLTSFATWLPTQPSNTSDDLLDLFTHQFLARQPQAKIADFAYLRQIPVHFQIASAIVLHHIQTRQPDLILCCGMAEERRCLSLEKQAVRGNTQLLTPLNLPALCQGLSHTEMSNDAGNFVCNYLYFSVLEYLQTRSKPTPALFVHVPMLTATNQAEVLADFCCLIERLTALPPITPTPEPKMKPVTVGAATSKSHSPKYS